MKRRGGRGKEERRGGDFEERWRGRDFEERMRGGGEWKRGGWDEGRRGGE